jgi:hypothetical protein
LPQSHTEYWTFSAGSNIGFQSCLKFSRQSQNLKLYWTPDPEQKGTTHHKNDQTYTAKMARKQLITIGFQKIQQEIQEAHESRPTLQENLRVRADVQTNAYGKDELCIHYRLNWIDEKFNGLLEVVENALSNDAIAFTFLTKSIHLQVNGAILRDNKKKPYGNYTKKRDPQPNLMAHQATSQGPPSAIWQTFPRSHYIAGAMALAKLGNQGISIHLILAGITLFPLAFGDRHDLNEQGSRYLELEHRTKEGRVSFRVCSDQASNQKQISLYWTQTYNQRLSYSQLWEPGKLISTGLTVMDNQTEGYTEISPIQFQNLLEVNGDGSNREDYDTRGTPNTNTGPCLLYQFHRTPVELSGIFQWIETNTPLGSRMLFTMDFRVLDPRQDHQASPNTKVKKVFNTPVTKPGTVSRGSKPTRESVIDNRKISTTNPDKTAYSKAIRHNQSVLISLVVSCITTIWLTQSKPWPQTLLSKPNKASYTARPFRPFQYTPATGTSVNRISKWHTIISLIFLLNQMTHCKAGTQPNTQTGTHKKASNLAAPFKPSITITQSKTRSSQNRPPPLINPQQKTQENTTKSNNNGSNIPAPEPTIAMLCMENNKVGTFRFRDYLPDYHHCYNYRCVFGRILQVTIINDLLTNKFCSPGAYYTPRFGEFLKVRGEYIDKYQCEVLQVFPLKDTGCNEYPKVRAGLREFYLDPGLSILVSDSPPCIPPDSAGPVMDDLNSEKVISKSILLSGLRGIIPKINFASLLNDDAITKMIHSKNRVLEGSHIMGNIHDFFEKYELKILIAISAFYIFFSLGGLTFAKICGITTFKALSLTFHSAKYAYDFYDAYKQVKVRKIWKQTVALQDRLSIVKASSDILHEAIGPIRMSYSPRTIQSELNLSDIDSTPLAIQQDTNDTESNISTHKWAQGEPPPVNVIPVSAQVLQDKKTALKKTETEGSTPLSTEGIQGTSV